MKMVSWTRTLLLLWAATWAGARPRKDMASSTSTAAVLGKRKGPREVGLGRGMLYLREPEFLASSVPTLPLIRCAHAIVTIAGGKRVRRLLCTRALFSWERGKVGGRERHVKEMGARAMQAVLSDLVSAQKRTGNQTGYLLLESDNAPRAAS